MIEPLAVRPMQWGVLPDLGNVLPLDATDTACMDELRAVLAKHGKLDRFAVHLAHKHFELAAGEVLVERPDPDGRTQHVEVGRLIDYPDAVPTTWLFDDGPTLHLTNAVYCVCQSASEHSDGACSVHGKSSSKSKTGQEQDALRERNYQEQEAKKQVGWPVAGHGLQIKIERGD